MIPEDNNIKIPIKEENINIKLANDLKESQKQTIFLSNKLNETIENYENEAKEREKLIKDLEFQLEEAKKNITKEITESQISNELSMFKRQFMRFGLGFWLNDDLPVSSWIKRENVSKFGYLSGGISLNFLFLNKININGNFGIKHNINNTIDPVIGIGLTYYF